MEQSAGHRGRLDGGIWPRRHKRNDFVIRDGVPYPVEVNPRWCASMELVELNYGLSIMGARRWLAPRVCCPSFEFGAEQGRSHAIGKAIVYARRDVVVGDTRRWLDKTDKGGFRAIRDVPAQGSSIRTGEPVCTVFPTGSSAEICHVALVRRAQDIYWSLDKRGGGGL